MRWHMEGLDAETGRERVLDIEASCEDRALEFASESRLLVERCTLVTDLVDRRNVGTVFNGQLVHEYRWAIGLGALLLAGLITALATAFSGGAKIASNAAGPGPTFSPGQAAPIQDAAAPVVRSRRRTLGISYKDIVGVDPDMVRTVEMGADGEPKLIGRSADGRCGMLVEGSADDIEYAHYFVLFPYDWLDENDPRFRKIPVAAAFQMVQIGSFAMDDVAASAKWEAACIDNGPGTYTQTRGNRLATLEVAEHSVKIALSCR